MKKLLAISILLIVSTQLRYISGAELSSAAKARQYWQNLEAKEIQEKQQNLQIKANAYQETNEPVPTIANITQVDDQLKSSEPSKEIKKAARKLTRDEIMNFAAKFMKVPHLRDDIYKLLFVALVRFDNEIIKLLLSTNLDLNRLNVFGSTLLSFVADKEMFDLFIQNGADINQRDHVGNTTLIDVIPEALTNPQKIIYLLDAGADVTIANNAGQTFLTRIRLPGNKAALKVYNEFLANIVKEIRKVKELRYIPKGLPEIIAAYR